MGLPMSGDDEDGLGDLRQNLLFPSPEEMTGRDAIVDRHQRRPMGYVESAVHHQKQ